MVWAGQGLAQTLADTVPFSSQVFRFQITICTRDCTEFLEGCVPSKNLVGAHVHGSHLIEKLGHFFFSPWYKCGHHIEHALKVFAQTRQSAMPEDSEDVVARLLTFYFIQSPIDVFE